MPDSKPPCFIYTKKDCKPVRNNVSNFVIYGLWVSIHLCYGIHFENTAPVALLMTNRHSLVMAAFRIECFHLTWSASSATWEVEVRRIFFDGCSIYFSVYTEWGLASGVSVIVYSFSILPSLLKSLVTHFQNLFLGSASSCCCSLLSIDRHRFSGELKRTNCLQILMKWYQMPSKQCLIVL